MQEENKGRQLSQEEEKRILTDDEFGTFTYFDSFDEGNVVPEKKKGHLPAMGWNSWNAFGSGNTEALTKEMADKICELGLRELGYSYVVLDDGCYKQERVNGKLSNEEEKFPGGFRALSDYIHSKGLKFGMYNDIGTNLCAGAAVGTCGFEEEDAESYVEWGVDFLKVDNCYYPFDNATFSTAENARYTFAPNIRAIKIGEKEYRAAEDGKITGHAAGVREGSYVTGIGTFDGTGPKYSPLGVRSSELAFNIESDCEKETCLYIEYATGKREGVGEWLQIAVQGQIIFDGFLPATEGEKTFVWSEPVSVLLKKGMNTIRLMNHRRQENTLNSYARLLKKIMEKDPEKDIIYSACEWGKTQPQNWAKNVCDSWRILNDITFRVGSDGDPGHGDWESDYTTGVTVQYNKAVIMDGFAGLEKGWNDPDMLMIGMDGLDIIQNKTHMAMWCMMNAPLMLGLDLRRVEKGDELHTIIANKELIGINQDTLGIQAKRVYSSLADSRPDRRYIRDNDRVDILAKPLENGRFAISFINVSKEEKKEGYEISVDTIKKYFGDVIATSDKYEVYDVWTGERELNTTGVFKVEKLYPCDNVTIVVEAVKNEIK